MCSDVWWCVVMCVTMLHSRVSRCFSMEHPGHIPLVLEKHHQGRTLQVRVSCRDSSDSQDSWDRQLQDSQFADEVWLYRPVSQGMLKQGPVYNAVISSVPCLPWKSWNLYSSLKMFEESCCQALCISWDLHVLCCWFWYLHRAQGTWIWGIHIKSITIHNHP